MTQEELLRVVQSRGHQARIQKDEVVLEHCVFCGNDRGNLELNLARGVYHCWVCGEGGSLRSLLANEFRYITNIPVDYESAAGTSSPVLPDHHDLESVSVLEVGSAMKYLERRGITADDVVQYKIRFCTDDRSPLKNRILFPLRSYWEQHWIGYTGRAYLGEKPKYFATYATQQIAGYRKWSAIHVVVEGPVDGVAVSRAGYSAAMLLGQRLEGLAEWASRIPESDKVVVLLDGAAHKRSEQVYWTLEPIISSRVFSFRLPPTLDPGQLQPDAVIRVITTALERRSERDR